MQKESQRIIQISNALHKASDSISILKNITWDDSIKETFFKNNAQKLPVVSYNPYNPEPVLTQIKEVRKLLGSDTPIDKWARRIANKLESSALLLNSRGTSDFFKHSSDLFGKPHNTIHNGMCTTYDLAIHFDQLFENIKHLDLGAPTTPSVTAQELAQHMGVAVKEIFGDLAPAVVFDSSLASNVLAGRSKISIRPNARFTDKDIDQLIHHEAHVHVATALNGEAQQHLKILGVEHAGTTITQEGLAIFAEFITGNSDLDRIQRLSDRVLAIQMAIDGADFIEIYRYFLDKTDNKEQSFQNAKRVCRGGLVSGKAPFTKDIVYLEGLIDVHSFLRVAMTSGKLEHLDLLFCGKLDIRDLPALKQLSDMGLITKPKFLPPWIQDKRYLFSYLSYATFLNKINLENTKDFYKKILI